MITSEVGQNGCQTKFMDEYLDWSDRNGIGYLAWAWSDLSEADLPEPGCLNFALIDDLEETPREPYGVAYKAHLLNPKPEDPEPLPPVVRELANLSISSARVAARKIRAKARVNPLANGRLQAVVRLRRGRAKRTSNRELVIRSDRAKLLLRYRKGWKPLRLKLNYTGNGMVRTGTASLHPKGKFEKKRRNRR